MSGERIGRNVANSEAPTMRIADSIVHQQASAPYPAGTGARASVLGVRPIAKPQAMRIADSIVPIKAS